MTPLLVAGIVNGSIGGQASSLAIRSPRVLTGFSFPRRIIHDNGRNDSVVVYCGIDWAEGHHDVALVDGDGMLLAKRRINESVAGFAELVAMFAELGDGVEAL